VKATDSGLILGPVLLRLGAYLIDFLILSVLGLGAISGGLVEVGENSLPADARSAAVLMGLGALYNIGYVAWKSATPGKMALNIYVAYPDGSPVRPDTAILRHLVILVGNIIFIGAVISVVLMFTDKRRRTLHDRVAGTMVLAGRAGAPLRAEPDLRQEDR